MLKELLLKNRSYRRFVQNVRITREELAELVGLTRYCASGRNAQALKYKVVADADLCGKVFPNLAWAGYLKDWDGPEEGERPAAYLIQLLDTSIVGSRGERIWRLYYQGFQERVVARGVATAGAFEDHVCYRTG